MITGVTHDTTPRELADKADAWTGLLANFAKYVKVDEAGCWIWGGALGTYGTPKARDGGRTVEVQRALHDHCFEPIPAGMYAVRTCEVQLCVHPDHVRPGTLAEARRRDPLPQCRSGHDTSAPDTRVGGTMAGACKQCAARRAREQRARVASGD